jgi:hypothetical protein
MLNQGAAAGYVKQLQSTANGEHRNIGGQGLSKQANLQFIPGIVHFIAPGVCLAISRRIDVGATSEQQAMQRIERLGIPNGLNADLAQGLFVRTQPGFV